MSRNELRTPYPFHNQPVVAIGYKPNTQKEPQATIAGVFVASIALTFGVGLALCVVNSLLRAFA